MAGDKFVGSGLSEKRESTKLLMSNNPQGGLRVIPSGLITLISLLINEGHCTPR